MAKDQQGKGPNPVAAFFGFGLGPRPQTKTRQKAQTRPLPTGEESAQPVPAHTFTWAHFFLLGALIFCVLQLYKPLTTYIRQGQEIAAVEQNIASLQEEKKELEAQINWWQDDNYVRQQARSRLFYIEPGETPYLVVGADSTSTLADDTSAAAKTAPEDSWTTKLWSSVQVSAEVEGATAPAEGSSPTTSADAGGEASESPAPASTSTGGQ